MRCIFSCRRINVSSVLDPPLALSDGGSNGGKAAIICANDSNIKERLADGVGFEPTNRLRDCRISSPVHSTALPPILVPCVMQPFFLLLIFGRVPGFVPGSRDRRFQRERAPHAAILFDKFHIMRHLGKALDEVRKGRVCAAQCRE